MNQDKYRRVERRIADRQARRRTWRQSDEPRTTFQTPNQAPTSYLAVLAKRRKV